MDPNSELYQPKTPTLFAHPLVNLEGIRLVVYVQSPAYISTFLIERRSGSGSFARITEIPGGDREYIDTTISTNTTYTYRVTSFWKKNSASSNESSATWIFSPPTGAAFFLPMSTSGVGMTWTHYSGFASGFILERSADGQNFQEVSRLPTDVRIAVDSTVTQGNQYSYRVRAFTPRSISNPSNTVRVQFLQAALYSLPPKHLPSSVTSVAFSPDGRHWVSGSGESCQTWTLGTSSQVVEMLNPLVTAVASSGPIIAASGTTRSIALRFEPFATIVISPVVPAKAIAFSADGSRIATCTVQGVAISFSSSGSDLRTFQYDSTRSAAFRPDGSMFAVGADGRVGVWLASANTYTFVQSIQVPGNNNIRVGFSSDGTRIIGGGTDGIVRVWDAVAGTEVNSWNTGGSIKSLSSVAGKILTVGNSDAHLWDLTSGTLDHTFPSGGLTPTTGDLSTNGRLVLVGHSNGTVNLWSFGNHWWVVP